MKPSEWIEKEAYRIAETYGDKYHPNIYIPSAIVAFLDTLQPPSYQFHDGECTDSCHTEFTALNEPADFLAEGITKE